MYLEVPIIGTGLSREDAFRPDLPEGTEWNANIPTGADGRPIHTKCVVWVADGSRVPAKATVLSITDARVLMTNYDDNVDPMVMERVTSLRRL